jgi:hypothetical protein
MSTDLPIGQSVLRQRGMGELGMIRVADTKVQDWWSCVYSCRVSDEPDDHSDNLCP